MTGSPPPLPISPTGQLAESLPGFDPAPVINAGEQRLADYLGMPTQQILDQLGLHHLPSPEVAAPATPGAPAHPGGSMSPIDPTQLISPVINALSTLGSGQFSGVDPKRMLNGISNAFDGTSGPLQQALGAVQHGWKGASSAAAAAKTGAALANGAEVARQATGLKSSLASAAADVAQARTQLIEIIHEYMATLTASLPFLPFSLPTIIAAAAKAVAHTSQVMTELQSSLAALAGGASAMGAPVPVTAAPLLGASGAGALGSLLGASTKSTTGPMSAMSMLSPLMYVASAGISPVMSAVSAAGGAGSSATGATTGTLAGDTAADPQAAAAGGALGVPAAPVSPAGGGGGAAPSGALVSRATAPMPPATAETAMTAAPAASIRPAAGGMPMTGAGMMGAPLAAASHANGAGGAHTAASYLHTSDQGGKVIEDQSTVAPPVIGEADPYKTSDIELRI